MGWQSGVHGRVMSSVKAQPLAATISVRGIDHPVSFSSLCTFLYLRNLEVNLQSEFCGMMFLLNSA